MKAKEILISEAIVYKKLDSKSLWFLVQQGDGDEWEIPKTTVRRGESSVRAVLRMTGEQGGMRAKVLEEVGRHTGSTLVNNKVVPQRYLYYLLLQRGESEVLGFAKAEWFEFKKAMTKLTSKKEQKMLEKARDMSKEIQRTRHVEDEQDIEEEISIGE